MLSTAYHAPGREHGCCGSMATALQTTRHVHAERAKQSILRLIRPEIVVSPPISYLLSPISYLLSPISYLLPPISYLLSPTSYLLSPISYLLSPTSYLLPPTSYLLPPISYLLSPISSLLPPPSSPQLNRRAERRCPVRSLCFQIDAVAVGAGQQAEGGQIEEWRLAAERKANNRAGCMVTGQFH